MSATLEHTESVAVQGDELKIPATPLTGEIVNPGAPSEVEPTEFSPVPYPERHEEAATFSADDLGLGQRIALHFREELRYAVSSEGGTWMVYDWAANVWRPDRDGKIAKKLARRVINELFEEAPHVGKNSARVRELDRQVRKAEELPESGIKEVMLKDAEKSLEQERAAVFKEHMAFYRNCRSGRSHAADALEAAADLLEIPATAFDVDPHRINTPEGVLDLKTLTVEPAGPQHLWTKVTATSYRAGARHPLVDEVTAWYDESGHAGLGSFMQRFLGTGLLGITPDKTAFYLDGAPDTAKSTVMESVVSAIGSDLVTGYAATSSAKAFVVSKGDANSANLALHRLAGRRFLFCDEADSVGMLDREVFKTFVSGEERQTRGLHEGFTSHRPVASICFAGNGVFGVPSGDPGVHRRFRASKLTKPLPNPDPQVREELKELAPREALFAWLAQGAQQFLLDGATQAALKMTDSIAAHTAEYMKEAQPLAAFLDDVTEQVDTQAKDYLPLSLPAWSALYIQWRKVNGGRDLPAHVLRAELLKLGELTKNPTTRRWEKWESKQRLLLGLKYTGNEHFFLKNAGHIKQTDNKEGW